MELTQKIGHRWLGFVDWLGNGDTICKITIFLPIISKTKQIISFSPLFSVQKDFLWVEKFISRREILVPRRGFIIPRRGFIVPRRGINFCYGFFKLFAGATAFSDWGKRVIKSIFRPSLDASPYSGPLGACSPKEFLLVGVGDGLHNLGLQLLTQFGVVL